jgi:hypothetical protein
MDAEKVCGECPRRFYGRRNSLYCSPACKFWSMFDKSAGPDACWLWKSTLTSNGYGNVPGTLNGGRRTAAHRHAYRLHTGIDPGKLSVCHDCDHRSCGNPNHLWAGTQRDNMMDAICKGKLLAIAPGELHPRAKLSDEKARAIMESNEPAAVLAVRYGVAKATIYAVLSGRTWRHVMKLSQG